MTKQLKGALVRQGCTDMTEIKETWIKLRHDDADEKIVGHYIVTNAILKMCSALLNARREARHLIKRLIDFLNQNDPYVMTELEDEADLEDVGDSEPSLGSFDRI